MSIATPWTLLFGAFVLYAGLCSARRHEQRCAIEVDFHRRRGPLLSSMTLEDAWKIQKWLAEQEFPKTLSTAVFFALFKVCVVAKRKRTYVRDAHLVQTYGIPSIAILLTSTGHMTSSFLSLSRRTADTGQLLNNAIIAPPHSKRSIEAIVRTAWIHRGFRKAGKITNDEMLYTLSLFALEGMRWVELYEWRCLTDLEICAVGLFWRQIGQDLDISYADLNVPLQSSGLEWHRALEQWSCAYESKHMAPHPCNHTLAVATLDLLGAGLPALAQRFAGVVFCYLMGPKLRHAMRYAATCCNLIYDEPQLTPPITVCPRRHRLLLPWSVAFFEHGNSFSGIWLSRDPHDLARSISLPLHRLAILIAILHFDIERFRGIYLRLPPRNGKRG
jgi:hypothetical protein